MSDSDTFLTGASNRRRAAAGSRTSTQRVCAGAHSQRSCAHEQSLPCFRHLRARRTACTRCPSGAAAGSGRIRHRLRRGAGLVGAPGGRQAPAACEHSGHGLGQDCEQAVAHAPPIPGVGDVPENLGQGLARQGGRGDEGYRRGLPGRGDD